MNALLRATLRSLTRSVPPVRWLRGVYRYAQFRKRLAREERTYDPSGRVPPPMLRFRVHGALDAESYRGVGQAVAGVIRSELSLVGIGLEKLVVLDFACGPGRVLSELAPLSRECKFFGCDIDAVAIAWACKNLSRIAKFEVNSTSPPLPYALCTFDLIYSISLFTHLDEAAQFLWLTELQRILKPRGIAFVTLHGAHARSSFSAGETARLSQEGFLFRVDHKGRLKLDGLPDGYQTAFHSREYVLREWSRFFEILAYHDGGMHGHQDIVILRNT